ncbi:MULTISPECIES: hypothetical protein [Serratia]|uniref:hypothetical protein n=1 Tax=Serratia TaxID=613 RepID=UPI00100905D8|nr:MULTISPECIES: hypothetical protein [Serratia]MBH3293327.1 hypothetical protein [Serratia marcescens]MDX6804251.1 hypothetical protein [Serratia marcescens]MDX6909016.1 hypothetical protein [Serratia marcescens]RXG74108.1 hypothetical protein D4G80_23830 [Serratia marcescens]RXG74321.1 hypothetical protein D5F12_23840 [Serratia marcescens]
MSEDTMDYQRGYIEMVRLCATLLIVLAEKKLKNTEDQKSQTHIETLHDEAARLLNHFPAPDVLTEEKHDNVFHRLIDMFTELEGNDDEGWQAYQPMLKTLYSRLH